MEYGPEEDMSSAAEALRDISHEVGLAHRRLGTLIEPHWPLGERGYGYDPPMEQIWRTAAPGTLADADVRLMSPEFVPPATCLHYLAPRAHPPLVPRCCPRLPGKTSFPRPCATASHPCCIGRFWPAADLPHCQSICALASKTNGALL